jgi:importin subunit beta-1
MASPAIQARQASSQAVAKIAAIELPAEQWPELIDQLTANVTASDNAFLKQATLECLGYICEEIVSARPPGPARVCGAAGDARWWR